MNAAPDIGVVIEWDYVLRSAPEARRRDRFGRPDAPGPRRPVAPCTPEFEVGSMNP